MRGLSLSTPKDPPQNLRLVHLSPPNKPPCIRIRRHRHEPTCVGPVLRDPVFTVGGSGAIRQSVSAEEGPGYALLPSGGIGQTNS